MQWMLQRLTSISGGAEALVSVDGMTMETAMKATIHGDLLIRAPKTIKTMSICRASCLLEL